MENIEAAYQSTLDYLYSFIDYSLTRQLRYSPEKFDLGRMFRLVEMLGSPHRQFPVIHVAGTKGKGSTCALIANVFQQAGYRVGLYISPHLVDFAERIQINRVPISHEQLVELVEQLKPCVEKIERLTTFELTTAAAFLYFASEKVDIAVIEVGLGGRLDATNVVDPLVSVITSLSLDHMNVLGDTLEKIAAEKGGIIKSGKPLFVAPQKPTAIEVLRQIAAERHSPVTVVDEAYRITPLSHSLSGQTFEIQLAATGGKTSNIGQLYIPLIGRHQLDNALTAYAVLDHLRIQGWKLTQKDIQDGFASVTWPARFEVVHENPLVVVDSAHNLDSAEKLAQTMRDYLPEKPAVLIFGASEDKDVTGMFRALSPVVNRIIITRSIHPRAFDISELGEIAKSYGIPVDVIQPLEAAIDRGLASLASNGVLLITGSIFIAAGAREYLKERFA